MIAPVLSIDGPCLTARCSHVKLRCRRCPFLSCAISGFFGDVCTPCAIARKAAR